MRLSLAATTAGLVAATTLVGPAAVARPTVARGPAYAAGAAAPAARSAQPRLRLQVRAPAGVPTTVTVRGPRTVTVALDAGGTRVVRRRLPPGRYVVRADRSSGPVVGATGPRTGTVYRPVVSRRHFRVTRGDRGRIPVTVRMQALRGGFRLTAAATPQQVVLSWRLPRHTTAHLCRGDSVTELQSGPCPTVVSATSGIVRRVLDRRAPVGLGQAYGLLVQAGRGPWVLAAVRGARRPFGPRPQFAVEPGARTRASVSGAGVQADEASTGADLSADGRMVTFSSAATTLVPGTVGGRQRTYLRDRRTGTTTLLRAGDHDGGLASISDDGRWVVVQGWTGDHSELHLYDVARRTSRRIAPEGWDADVSADGRRVVYVCDPDVEPYDAYGAICLYDRVTRQTTRLAPADDGRDLSHPRISGDGRFVAFDDLLGFDDDYGFFGHVDRLDLRTGETVHVTANDLGTPEQYSQAEVAGVNDDGSVLYSYFLAPYETGDLTYDPDILFYDGTTGATSRVPVDRSVFSSASDLLPFDASMSADGRFVTVQLIDRPEGDYYGDEPAGGFLIDRTTGVPTLLAPPPDAQSPTYSRIQPVLSADGEHVALVTDLPLGTGDSNGVSDVYVLDRTG